jgi:hypothetical protein
MSKKSHIIDADAHYGAVPIGEMFFIAEDWIVVEKDGRMFGKIPDSVVSFTKDDVLEGAKLARAKAQVLLSQMDKYVKLLESLEEKK